MKSKYFLLVLLAAGMSSCRKYVDIKTQGILVPKETSNYRYLLNYTYAYEQGPKLDDIASDDVQLVDGSSQFKALNGSDYYGWFPKAYVWNPVVFPIGNYQTDDAWNGMYNTILYCNTVIEEVPASTGGTATDKAELIAEAKVHRADAYLMLMNTYAKPYNAATAGSDLGVPLILVETTQQSLARPSSQSVYTQIIADLNQALPNLLPQQSFNTIPSKASAYGELARCYLYMNDYANANKYADSALLTRSTLNDYSTSSTFPLRKSDPEILLSKVAVSGVGYQPTIMRLSDDLLNLLGTTDQRYQLFTKDAKTFASAYADAGGRFFSRDRINNESRNIGPNVPEMLLIKAEYYARNNDISNALLWVNKLRQKRFKPADYTPATANTAADALKTVIDERHREFFCRMLRWWDMRRLKSEPAFQKTYTRVFGGVTYTLDPQSNRYVFQIPPYQIQLNPEMQQNP